MSEEHNFPGEPEPRRRAPAGQALAAVLVALVVGSLLNADRMAHTAETQPFGWQRTWAMRLTGPVQAISDLTGLNRPRKVVSDAVGTTDGPPPENTRSVVTAPPLAGATTTIVPLQVRAATEDEPLRIHIAGDSLMIPVGPAILSTFDGDPVTLTEGYKSATGLARPDVLNWPAKLRADMAASDPDVVVLGFGGNDAQGMEGPDGPLQAGTAAWGAEYQRRVVQVLDAIEKPGRTVYWMSLPVTTAGNIEDAAPFMREAVESEIAVRPWAHFIDTGRILTPGGSFTAYLPDGSGGQVKVREDDGVHLTTAGATRAVVPLCELVAEERKLG
ncbi:MAG: putative periplasmic protein [Acidimicrobiales bacterium]|nr:putative periplasmic protein [Acidimicrobiales bacterium]